ncbi:MAG: DNA-directed RNA polymerase subunit omega [Coriobacteriia bacterium]|nr:DNA-directed RNA polymerase subunit omega [Coriobacteriia bacterium]
MSIINPEVDVLLEKVDSKFTLCTLAAKRACQINDMVHGVREQALSAMATSEIAKLTSAKPLALAMDEIARGDVLAEAPLPQEATTVEPANPQAETDALPAIETDDLNFSVAKASADDASSAPAEDLLG